MAKNNYSLQKNIFFRTKLNYKTKDKQNNIDYQQHRQHIRRYTWKQKNAILFIIKNFNYIFATCIIV